MITTSTILIFFARVIPGRERSLQEWLLQIAAQVEARSFAPFSSLEGLHFASLVMHRSGQLGTRLIFENNFDGSLDDYLPRLCRAALDDLHQIYLHCEGYDTAENDRGLALEAYLRAHVVRPNAFHIGNTGRACGRILQEKELRERLETFADSVGKSERSDPPAVLFAKFRRYAAEEFPWTGVFDPREHAGDRWANRLRLIGFIALAVVFLPVLLVLFLILLGKERTDSVQQNSAERGKLNQLLANEDRSFSVQNHMASVAAVKPGWLRLFTLRFVLQSINLLARVQATKGQLSGITSIHFAHWSLIDGGRNLLFLSNFDGSWENYLDDFIDKASNGLSAIWSNTVGFPRTTALVRGGAKDGPRFKAIARDSMTVTNVWYHAYPELTVRGIDNNSSLREGLSGNGDPLAAAAWLRCL